MQYFPVCLDISGRPCVVIGGGRVAARKVRALLDCGGRVTIFSPALEPGLDRLQAAGEVRWVVRPYRPGDLAGAFLVIAATDDPEVQAMVHAEAMAHNILLNVADVPKWCNFILPATLRRGDLSVSVSTGGGSPALARRLRERLEQEIGPEYGIVLAILSALRPAVLAEGHTSAANKEIFLRLAEELLGPIRDSDWPAIERSIRTTVGGTVNLDCLSAIRAQFNRTFAGSDCQ